METGRALSCLLFRLEARRPKDLHHITRMQLARQHQLAIVNVSVKRPINELKSAEHVLVTSFSYGMILVSTHSNSNDIVRLHWPAH